VTYRRAIVIIRKVIVQKAIRDKNLQNVAKALRRRARQEMRSRKRMLRSRTMASISSKSRNKYKMVSLINSKSPI
jgi:hypothetical protein